MFVAVRAESKKLGELRVDPGERMGGGNGIQFADVRACTKCNQSRAAVSLPVERNDQGVLETGGIECASRMTQVMVERLDAIRFAAGQAAEGGNIVGFRPAPAGCLACLL